MNKIIGALCISVLIGAGAGAGAVEAQSPNVFLFDVMTRPEYQRAYATMIRGEPGLPGWMATPKSVVQVTATPGKLRAIGPLQAELFHACKPHFCSDSMVEILFSGFPVVAKGALQNDGHVKLLGGPSAEESAILLKLLPGDE